MHCMACDSHARTCRRYVQLSYDLALCSRNNMLRCMQDHQQAVTPRGHHARVGMQTKRVVVLWAVGKAARGVPCEVAWRYACPMRTYFSKMQVVSHARTHTSKPTPNPHVVRAAGWRARTHVSSCARSSPRGRWFTVHTTARALVGRCQWGWTFLCASDFGELEPKNRTSLSRIGPTQCGALGSPPKPRTSLLNKTSPVRVLACCPSCLLGWLGLSLPTLSARLLRVAALKRQGELTSRGFLQD
jgi:hypothetical protein